MEQQISHAQLRQLRDSATLTPGQYYRITDFRTIHLIPHTTRVNTGPIEPLLVLASATNKFSPAVHSTVYGNDVIAYDIDNVLCEDGATARPGKITAREDKVSRLKAGYDWRAVRFYRGRITGHAGQFLASKTGETLVFPAGTDLLAGQTFKADFSGVGSAAHRLTAVSSGAATQALRAYNGYVHEVAPGGLFRYLADPNDNNRYTFFQVPDLAGYHAHLPGSASWTVGFTQWAVNTADFKDVLTFNDSITGGGCTGIEILPTADNQGYNNIVITGGAYGAVTTPAKSKNSTLSGKDATLYGVYDSVLDLQGSVCIFADRTTGQIQNAVLASLSGSRFQRIVNSLVNEITDTEARSLEQVQALRFLGSSIGIALSATTFPRTIAQASLSASVGASVEQNVDGAFVLQEGVGVLHLYGVATSEISFSAFALGGPEASYTQVPLYIFPRPGLTVTLLHGAQLVLNRAKSVTLSGDKGDWIAFEYLGGKFYQVGGVSSLSQPASTIEGLHEAVRSTPLNNEPPASEDPERPEPAPQLVFENRLLNDDDTLQSALLALQGQLIAAKETAAAHAITAVYPFSGASGFVYNHASMVYPALTFFERVGNQYEQFTANWNYADAQGLENANWTNASWNGNKTGYAILRGTKSFTQIN